MRNQVFTRLNGRRRFVRGAVVALGLLLGGCEGRFSADLATDAPADTAITSVQVNLLGLQFRTADGATATLQFRAGELVDLFDLRVGDPLRLFTSEQLPAGTYTGTRLLFDANQDASAVTTNDGNFPLLLAEGAFVAVDFTVVDDEDSSEALTLTLDLRQSLRFDDVDGEYTLTPLLRTVRTREAAQIQGSVNVACPAGTSLTPGGAVYLFAGADVVPDDIDGTGVEPFATTSVVDPGTGAFSYALRFLSADDYTLALTCRGNEDVLGADDDLEFGNIQNVSIDAGDVLRLNLT
jgi:hypothetical protein